MLPEAGHLTSLLVFSSTDLGCFGPHSSDTEVVASLLLGATKVPISDGPSVGRTEGTGRVKHLCLLWVSDSEVLLVASFLIVHFLQRKE